MKTPCIPFRNALLALALLSAPALASAGVIDLDFGEGNVPALLYADAGSYTDAMYGAVIDLQPDLFKAGGGKALGLLTSKVHGATLGRFEYTYTDVDGSTRTVVYHARSGHSLKATLDIAAKKKGGTSGSESSTGNSSTTESGEATTGATEDVSIDRSEDRFYPPDTVADKRAVKLPPEESVLDSMDVGDRMNHSWDAELKALRSIEADINSGEVLRGGKLTGYVSKAVCESCRNVIKTFAEKFDVDGKVYQMIEAEAKEVVTDLSTPIARSKVSSSKFKLDRKRYVRETFAEKGETRPTPRKWTDKWSLERTEAEEAATLTKPGGGC